MIINKAKDEKRLREATEISMNILSEAGRNVREGIFPVEIDNIIGELCLAYGVKPAFNGFEGYPANSCISVNNEILHGIPSDSRALEKGDIVSIDFGVIHKGYYSDHCWTFSVGEPNEKDSLLLKASREATESAVKLAVVGNTVGDLGNAMESTAKKYGFNVLRQFVGHGIGKRMHDDPEIPAFGVAGKGDRLVDGMVICVECQVVDGSGDYIVDDNGWTILSKEGGKSSMYEYMLIVRKDHPEILTDMRAWDVIVEK